MRLKRMISLCVPRGTNVLSCLIIILAWRLFVVVQSVFIIKYLHTMALQQTAHDACSRRVHCVAKGYLDDPFVKHFSRDSTIVNSPLMNRGSWLRAIAFENMVHHFSKLHQGTPIQVVSFGAGVDTLYFRLRRENTVALASYVELDFPDLVQEKRTIIEHNNDLKSLATSDAPLHVEAADLRHPDQVVSVLRRCCSPDVPTLLIAECVFVYIENQIVENLLHSVLEGYFSPSCDVMLVTYDVIEPHDRFGAMMAENLRHRGITLDGVEGAPTLASHVMRCHKVGLRTARAVTMKTLYLGVPRSEQVRLNRLEMIDDWDEWNLVHEHYAFVIGWRGGDGTPSSIPSVFPSEQPVIA